MTVKSCPPFVLLGAPTSRTRAYLEALAERDLAPQMTILYGKENLLDVTIVGGYVNPSAENYSDLCRSVAPMNAGDLLAGVRSKTQVVSAGSVNDDQLVKVLFETGISTIVFSGYPGEIVRGNALAAGKFLHVHPGKLPNYRGSTTAHYSLLQENQVWASLLVLDKGIDTGEVLLRRQMPLPATSEYFDQIYDPSIRATLLATYLAGEAENEPLLSLKESPEDARTYYVIHPLLRKHAIEKLGPTQKDPSGHSS